MYFNKLKERKNRVKACSMYLRNGRYLTDQSFRIFYRRKNKKLAVVESKNTVNLFMKPSLIKKVFSRLFSVKIKNKENKYNGIILIVSNSTSAVRIIHEDENSMLIKFFNKEDYFGYKSRKEQYGKYFNTVTTMYSDDNELVIAEPFIKKEKCISGNKLVNFFNDFENACLNIAKDNATKDYEFTDDIACKLRDFVKKLNIENEYGNIKEFLNLNNICTISHGDLHEYNVLYSEGKNYYIDFDKLENRVFLYDLFFYLLYFNEGDNIKKYRRGLFDRYFEKIFKALGFSFNNKKRELYFNVFLFHVYLYNP